MMNKNSYHIRPILIEDTHSFFDLMYTNRERLKLYFPISSKQVKDEKSARKFVQEKLTNAQKRLQFAFVIEHQETRELAGYLIVKNLDWTSFECELAYWLGDGFEGQGIMSYSMKHIIQFCFHYLKLNRIYLRIDPTNDKSRNLAKKSAFTLHHIADKEYRRGDDVWIDVEYWALLNTRL